MDEDKRIAELEKVVRDQSFTIKALEQTVAELSRIAAANEERVKRHIEALRALYEKSSEQLLLFNDAEVTSGLGAAEDAEASGNGINVRRYVRRKSGNASVSLPADTPVIDVHDDSSMERCSRCGAEMKVVGEKVYESFSRVSYTVVVRRHVNLYSCTQCTPDDADEGRIAETPSTGNMLDGTICDPSLLANIIYNKYALGLPLYRQQGLFADAGLSRFTMSSWLMKVGRRLADNMVPVLEEEVYRRPLVNMDETPLKVLELRNEKGEKKAPGSRYNAYMAVRAATNADGSKGPVIFTYTENRRNDTLIDIIGNYGGALQTDGLSGYANAGKNGNFTHVGCWVHARRKAVEACGKRTSGTAFELVRLYADFFHQEGLLRDRWLARDFSSDDEYLAERRKVLEPLIEGIFEFCSKHSVSAMPKSALSVALAYPLERKESLMAFLNIPCATSGNQAAENMIRPFVVGRKSFLFCITETGAEVSAFLYSLVESCKAMGINVEDYLTWLFLNGNRVKDGDSEGWRKMLPGQSDISQGRLYREMLRTAKADPDRNDPYVLRGKRV